MNGITLSLSETTPHPPPEGVAFLGPLLVEILDSGRARVVTEWRARITLAGGRDEIIIIPRDTETDWASVPRLPLLYATVGNLGHKAALLHDHLYAHGLYPRAWCDAVFLAALAADGVGPARRRAMWLGVRAFGWLFFRGGCGCGG